MKRPTNTAPEQPSAVFSRASYQFFRELEKNNSRPWFLEHRAEYDAAVAAPLRSLAVTMAPVMNNIDGLFDLNEKRVLSRPHRDVRFSKDKSPYHTAAWLVFHRPSREWTGAPAYYLEISSEGIRYGMGFYQASPLTMQRLRKAIDEDPKRFRTIFARIEKQPHMKIEGESYARPFANPHGEWFQPYYQKRNIYVMCSIGRSTDTAALYRQLKKDFALLSDLYHYLLACLTA